MDRGLNTGREADCEYPLYRHSGGANYGEQNYKIK